MLRVLLAALVLAAFPALAQTVDVTQKGKLLLQRDGVTISSHNIEREAVQNAINHGPGTYRIVQPDIEIVVRKPVVLSSIEGKPPLAYNPACVTAGCRMPTRAERAAVRSLMARNTTTWLAVPGNLEKMNFPDPSIMYQPEPMP